MNKLAAMLLLLAGLLPTSLLASQNSRPVFQYQTGDEARHWLVGLGGWTRDNTHAMVYYSELHITDRASIDGTRFAATDYTSKRLGAVMESFNKGEAFNGGVYIYDNRSDWLIDRKGIGFNIGVGWMLTSRTRFFAGADLMFEPLSTDWDANALLEYELQTGITQKLSARMDLLGIYRYNGTYHGDTRSTNYDVFMAGIRFNF